MGLLSALQATARGIGRLPRIVGDASYERDPQFAYPDMPSMPYSGQVTPDGATYDMDLGGGPQATPKQIGTVRSNRPNLLGKTLAALPGIIQGGIAGASVPNIAGGGPTDIFRAAQGASENAHQHAAYQQDKRRQAVMDELNRQKEQAQIDDYYAQVAERLHKSQWPDKAEPRKYQNLGSNGYVDPSGVVHPPAPKTPATQAGTLDPKQAVQVGIAHGYESPEDRETNTIPFPGTKVPGYGLAFKMPPPEGYNVLPGTSGAHRVVLPSAETMQGIRNARPGTWTRATDADGNMKEVRVNANGEQEVRDFGRIGTPQRQPLGKQAAGKKSLKETHDERAAAAVTQGLNEEETKQYVLNGRLPVKSSKTGGVSGLLGSISGTPTQKTNPAKTPQEGLPSDAVIAQMNPGDHVRNKKTGKLLVKTAGGQLVPAQ